jgi:hypothetical protein
MTAMPLAFPHEGFGDAAGAARSEWRADEDAWTRAAVERWEHERTIVDVARECMHRGDTVTVQFSHRLFSGRVSAVGDDFFSLDLVDGRAHVSSTRDADFVLRIAGRARAGGERGDDVTTMRVRLLELETACRDVELGTADMGVVARGQLRVGRDHVLVRAPDTVETVVPMASVAWVLEETLSRK